MFLMIFAYFVDINDNKGVIWHSRIIIFPSGYDT